MSLKFRTIAKFCFLLVFIGLFMPMSCDKNAFQLADSGFIKSEAVFAIYAIFVSSIIGLIIGVLLLFKKPVPITIDWIVTVFCFLCTVIAFYIAGYVDNNVDYFQSGVYMVLLGAILVMLVQIIASCITDTDYSNNRRSYYSFNKRCRQCSTVYLGSASVCPKCGFSLYEEVADSSSAQPITIGDRSIEKKKCRSCKELVPVDIFKCPKCGNESFD